VNFDLLKPGYNYIDVRCWDIAGSTRTITDAFYIKKDTTPPVIIDNQTGDNIWRDTDPGATYNVDFKDTASKLNKAQYIVYSSSGMGSSLIINWTDIFNNLNQENYTSEWSVDFNSLKQGINYISFHFYRCVLYQKRYIFSYNRQ